MAKKSSINPSNETVFSIQINKNVDIDIKFFLMHLQVTPSLDIYFS